MTLKTRLSICSLSCLLLLNGCKIVQFTPSSSDPSKPDDHMGQFSVPDYKADDLRAAAIKTVEILNSEEFAKELNRYEQQLSTGGEYSAAWQNWTADKIVAGMRQDIQGLELETYGGPISALRAWFAGNLAYDGNAGYPIRLNRTVLRNRSIGQLCNSIAHETAHRVGLKHPHSDTDFKVALCEPPYVIGSIVRKIAEGAAWKFDGGTDGSCIPQ